MRAGEIIVGTDGTGASRTVVEWAAREAGHRNAPLRVVHAFDWEWAAARFDPCSENLDVARLLADKVVDQAVTWVREAAPGVEVDADALIGNPAPRLLEAAGKAALVVVGHRGQSGIASLVLGSVSRRVATHAPGPVVVVRGRGDATAGPVAAGVDDSHDADHVLRTAFQAADDRRALLTVIRTGAPGEEAAEHDRVEQLVAPWRDKFPEVPVEVLAAHGSPAAVLAGVSHTAQLVVVGNRGRGTVAGALLGSTGMELLHHADCPVWIARALPEGSR